MALDIGRPGAELSQATRERGFLTTALEGWGLPKHLRFSFGLPDENEAFVAVLKELAPEIQVLS